MTRCERDDVPREGARERTSSSSSSSRSEPQKESSEFDGSSFRSTTTWLPFPVDAVRSLASRIRSASRILRCGSEERRGVLVDSRFSSAFVWGVSARPNCPLSLWPLRVLSHHASNFPACFIRILTRAGNSRRCTRFCVECARSMRKVLGSSPRGSTK